MTTDNLQNCEHHVLMCVKSKHGCSSGMMSWTYMGEMCKKRWMSWEYLLRWVFIKYLCYALVLYSRSTSVSRWIIIKSTLGAQPSIIWAGCVQIYTSGERLGPAYLVYISSGLLMYMSWEYYLISYRGLRFGSIIYGMGLQLELWAILILGKEVAQVHGCIASVNRAL